MLTALVLVTVVATWRGWWSDRTMAALCAVIALWYWWDHEPVLAAVWAGSTWLNLRPRPAARRTTAQQIREGLSDLFRRRGGP